MSLLIILGFCINSVVFGLILITLLKSIETELRSGFRKFKKQTLDTFRGKEISSSEVRSSHFKKDDDFKHWDLSGGIFGI